MRKLLALLALVFMVGGGTAMAALVNVTGANYAVTEVFADRHAFGADLVQNGADETRTEVRIKEDAKCYWVGANGGADTPLSRADFISRLKKGTRVKVNGGRDWDGKVNASELWAQ